MTDFETNFSTIVVTRDDRVGTITLNRPKALNALNTQVMNEVITAAAEFDADPGIGAIVLTGNEKAFAAGADIKEMVDLSFADVFSSDFFAAWGKFAATRTPTIAAVAGYALGGGCELAMMCDLLIAADTAKFGQPEIKLGVLPGMGGSQRLTRAVGKAKAMDLILTGRNMDAEEAERAGLVSRVVPADTLLDEANAVAKTIAGMSLSASRMAKEAVNRYSRRSANPGVPGRPMRMRPRRRIPGSREWLPYRFLADRQRRNTRRHKSHATDAQKEKDRCPSLYDSRPTRGNTRNLLRVQEVRRRPRSERTMAFRIPVRANEIVRLCARARTISPGLSRVRSGHRDRKRYNDSGYGTTGVRHSRVPGEAAHRRLLQSRHRLRSILLYPERTQESDATPAPLLISHSKIQSSQDRKFPTCGTKYDC